MDKTRIKGPVVKCGGCGKRIKNAHPDQHYHNGACISKAVQDTLDAAVAARASMTFPNETTILLHAAFGGDPPSSPSVPW